MKRLPVAPRPFRNELMSSWLARVACRYGLEGRDLIKHWGVQKHVLTMIIVSAVTDISEQNGCRLSEAYAKSTSLCCKTAARLVMGI